MILQWSEWHKVVVPLFFKEIYSDHYGKLTPTQLFKELTEEEEEDEDDRYGCFVQSEEYVCCFRRYICNI
jgi:hypothetical protein